MMLDYWYVDTAYRQEVVSYVNVVMHVLSSGRYLTLNPLPEEPVGEDVIRIAEEEKEKKKEPVLTVYFDFDGWKLRKDQRERLRSLIAGRGYYLVGHADWIGKESYNYRLSLKRAEEVRKEMERLSFRIVGLEGRGESECNLRKGERISRGLIRELEVCRKVEVFEKEE